MTVVQPDQDERQDLATSVGHGKYANVAALLQGLVRGVGPGDYAIGHRIGEGGVGVVYSATIDEESKNIFWGNAF